MHCWLRDVCAAVNLRPVIRQRGDARCAMRNVVWLGAVRPAIHAVRRRARHRVFATFSSLHRFSLCSVKLTVRVDGDCAWQRSAMLRNLEGNNGEPGWFRRNFRASFSLSDISSFSSTDKLDFTAASPEILKHCEETFCASRVCLAVARYSSRCTENFVNSIPDWFYCDFWDASLFKRNFTRELSCRSKSPYRMWFFHNSLTHRFAATDIFRRNRGK